MLKVDTKIKNRPYIIYKRVEGVLSNDTISFILRDDIPHGYIFILKDIRLSYASDIADTSDIRLSISDDSRNQKILGDAPINLLCSINDGNVIKSISGRDFTNSKTIKPSVSIPRVLDSESVLFAELTADNASINNILFDVAFFGELKPTKTQYRGL